MLDFNQLAKDIHAEEGPKWWVNLDTGLPKERNNDEMLMLVISELAEALEGDRKNLMDDKLPHRKMPEVELADAAIRLLDIAGAYNYDFSDAIFKLKFTGIFSADLMQVTRIVALDYDDNEADLEFLVIDAVVAIERLAQHYGMDLEGAITEKMAYNRVRADHKRENRLKENGKKY